MFAPADDRGPASRADDEGTRGTVAEEGRGDDVALAAVAKAERQPAQLDHEEQDTQIGLGARLRRGAGHADNAARTSEAEDRQPAQVAAHLQALHQQCVQRWRRNPGARGDDNPVDIRDPQPRPFDAQNGGTLEKIDGVLDVKSVALGEVVRLAVPRQRDT